MKLTAFTDYSLRVLMYLATRPGERATIAQIASAFEVSENHLVKVVHFLGKQGWLKNVRGKGGGMELGLSPDKIVVGKVVRETEGTILLAECFEPDGGKCCIDRNCRLRSVLTEAGRAFYEVLDRHTLADVVRNRSQLDRILFVDKPPGRPRAPA